MNFHIFGILVVLFLFQNIDAKKSNEWKEWATHLNDETFFEFIESNKHVLVMFHTPGCIHCVRLVPIVHEVAKILTNKPSITEVPVKIAIVDISKSADLANKFNIKMTPMLKLFRDRHVYPYDGPREDAKCK